MYASWICANCCFSATAMAPADFDASRRSSNGFSGVNAMPEFGALVKPLIDRPGNAGTDSTPGVFKRDVGHAPDHGFGAIERRRVRQLREGDEVLLVLRRHEAGRRMRETERGQRDQAAVDEQRDAALAQHAADSRDVAVRCAGEETVERAEKPAEREIEERA